MRGAEPGVERGAGRHGERHERLFEEAFLAHQRGEHLEALMLWERCFLLDPSNEQALVNYARTLFRLGAGEGAPRRLRDIAERGFAPSGRGSGSGAAGG